MSSESSERTTANRGKKAPDDAGRYKKLQKALIYLFTKGGLKERNIQQKADDEVSVEDIVNSEHYSKQFSAEDFDHAVAKDCYDLILKEEPHFLLVTSDGCKVVKYHKEPLKYKERAKEIQVNDGADVDLSKEFVAAEKPRKEEEPGKNEEKVEQEQTAGGNKKKKNKKNKGGSGTSQGGGANNNGNNNQSKKEDEKSPASNVSVAKEATVSAALEAKTETKCGNNVKHQSDRADSILECPTSEEAMARDESAKSASEDKDQDISDSYDGFSPAVSKKSSKKSPEKKGKQSEALETKSSGNELKQNKDGKQTVESLGKAGKKTEGPADKAGKQTEKSSGKQPQEQKADESQQKKSKKQKATSDNVQKKPTDDAALTSDEEKTSVSPEGPPPKKKQKKPEDRLKKIPNAFNFLFCKNGLKEKNLSVGDGGFVQVKSIIEVFHSQYQWTEQEITVALDNSEDYIFKHDDSGVLLVKAAEQKSQPVETEEPVNDDSWQASGRRKEGQEDRKQRPLQSSAANRPPGVGGMTPEKLCSTLFWILAKDGAAKNSIQFQPGKRLIVDEIINKVPILHQVSASEIKAAAESDTRKTFLIEEIKGQTMIRLQENRENRPSKGDFFLSKTMSFILRHGAENLHLPIQPDGFLYVDDLLNYKDLRSYTEEDVRRVVAENDKKRFFLTEEAQTRRLKVRANQGHTLEVPDLELTPITSANAAPTVVHGTNHAAWKIIKTQGLSRMGRNHVHFAVGEPGADGVISGMRSSSDIVIYVDMEKALNDGIKFYRSANNVVLSDGDDRGIILPKYFKNVIQRNPRMKLM